MESNNFYKTQLRQHYVKITVKDFDKQIEGIVTNGTINVNGNSSLRRNGNLTCVIDKNTLHPDITNINNLISIKTKILIEIGLQNDIGAIVWFKQGDFVVSSASVTHDANNITLSISFKDKMALLNGDLGGTFTQSLIHTPIDVYNSEETQFTREPVTYRALIKTLVQEYSNLSDEQIHIKLSDNEIGEYQESWDEIDQIVTWTGTQPLYIYKQEDDGFYQLSFIDPGAGVFEKNIVNYGDAIGFQRIPFTYPTEKELTSNPGETVVSVLDKIKTTLGNFEYFFDINGEFWFQPIANFLNKGLSEDNLDNAIKDWKENNNISVSYGEVLDSGSPVFDFTDLSLITSFNNAPKYESIKNDLSITGIRGDNKTTLQYHLVFEDPDPQNSKLTVKAGTKFSKYDENGITKFRVDNNGKVINNLKNLDYRTQMYFGYLSCEEEKNQVLQDYPEWALWGKELKNWWPTTMLLDMTDAGSITETFSALQSLPSSLYNLNYYFEMIDLSEYGLNVSQIGLRTKAKTDNKVNIMFSSKPLDLYCIVAGTDNTRTERAAAIEGGKAFIQIPESAGRTVAQGVMQNAAYDHIRSMVHTTIQYNEGVNLAVVPIYNLEPNTLILAQDPDAGVKIPTLYEVKSFSIPLSYDGIMSISCVRATTMI